VENCGFVAPDLGKGPVADLVSTVKNFRVPSKLGNFLIN
jgi:hypothetical protein